MKNLLCSITVDTNTTALYITNKVATLLSMSTTCVDAHYLYFGTRNNYTPASTLQKIGVLDYEVIRLLMHIGGEVTIRERTSPLSASPTCEERQAQLLLCPANYGCKNSLPRLAENPGLSWTMDSEVKMLH